MKKVVFSLAALAMLVGAPSYGRDKKVMTTTTTTRTVDDAATSSSSSMGGSAFYLGVSSDTMPALGFPSLSALFGFSDKLALQVYMAIGSTTPFTFGAGGALKVTVVGSGTRGFHVGGGFGLGTTGAFTARIYGLLGLHFTVVDSVMVIADGSAGVNIGGAGTNFTVGANGGLLGLSLLFQI